MVTDPAGPSPSLTIAQRKRLRELWRSGGWPCRDAIEIELLAAGLIRLERDAQGRELLPLTESGLTALAGARRSTLASRQGHEALVQGVARALQREGRLVYTGLSLRCALPAQAAPPPPASTLFADDDATALPSAPAQRWVMTLPDVFSIRHGNREDQLDPTVHEIKVSRADLLGDLRRPDKAAAYRAVSARCWYVLREGIAEPEEIPELYGVMLACGEDLACPRLEVARPALPRPATLSVDTWLALARATPHPAEEEPAQAHLGASAPASAPK